MKKTVIATWCALMATVAYADVVKKEDLLVWDRSNLAGGVGEIEGRFGFKRDQAKETDAIKEIGWLRLDPGESIGYHKHENNEDAYIIISGEGTFTDADGTQHYVKAGDITIVRPGQSHALSNTGKTPLVILDVIAQR